MIRLRFAVLAAVATMPIVVGWLQVVHEFPPDRDLGTPALLTGATVAMLVPALVAEWRRPRNPMSWVAVVAATATAVSPFRLLRPAGLATLGTLAFLALPLVMCHLLLAIPDGVPRAQRRRVLVACWLGPAAFAVAVLAVAGPRDTVAIADVGGLRLQSWAVQDPAGHWFAQANLLVVRPSDIGLRVLWAGWALWIVAVAVSVVVLAARRWRRNEPDRATARLVLPAAIVTAVSVLATAFAARPHRDSTGTPFLAQWYGELVVVVPAVATAVVGALLVWSELVRPRLSQAVDGAVRLDAGSSPAALAEGIARSLGDPTVRVLFPSDEDGWLDDRGRATSLAAEPRRAATILTRGSEAVAAVEHDDWLLMQPDLLDMAITSLALTLDSRRLAAVAKASTEDTQVSATRLLDAGERARRRVDERLVDGPDRTLAAVSALLSAVPVPIADVHAGLRTAVAEVREIAHGIAPAALLEAGLEVALLDRAAGASTAVIDDVAADPLPAPVELTLYLVADDALRRAEGPLHVSVAVADGSASLTVVGWGGPLDQVLEDRIDTLAGTIEAVADRLVVALPLASD